MFSVRHAANFSEAALLCAASTPLIPRVGLLRIDATRYAGPIPQQNVNKRSEFKFGSLRGYVAYDFPLQIE